MPVVVLHPVIVLACQQIVWHGQASPPRSLQTADKVGKDAPAASTS
jgi:hypothetical protein